MEKGAYILFLLLNKTHVFSKGKFKGKELPCGIYAYAGSAYGPGGMQARVKRHLQKEKKLHWHIDYITTVYPIETYQLFPNQKECDLVRALQRLGGKVCLPSFGSSDCKNCQSHLLWFPSLDKNLIKQLNASL